MNSNTIPAGTHIGRTALQASDLEELTGFYRDIVGLSVQRRSNAIVVLGAGETPLLVLEQNEDTLARGRSEAGLYHNAFRVPSRAALGDALGRIRNHWRLSGASNHGVSEALYLTDPAGNGIEIYYDFPREEWPRTDDGGIKMGTTYLDLDSVEAAAGGESGVPPETDVGHVHLEVTSLEAFRDFYVDVLGFETQVTEPDALFVSAGGYHHHIGANVWHDRTSPSDGSGLAWFEIVLPETQALEAIQNQVADSQFSMTATNGEASVIGVDGIEIRITVESQPSSR
nr:VOC family protein [Halococcus hamelinensis]